MRHDYVQALNRALGGLDTELLHRRRLRIAGRAHATRIYERLALAAGEQIDGPAILEQPDTTVFVDPGLKVRVDRYGNLIMGERTARRLVVHPAAV